MVGLARRMVQPIGDGTDPDQGGISVTGILYGCRNGQVPGTSLPSYDSVVGLRGFERLWPGQLAWNFLLDCLTEGKNILFALLIVVPCEIKEKMRCRKKLRF